MGAGVPPPDPYFTAESCSDIDGGGRNHGSQQSDIVFYFPVWVREIDWLHICFYKIS